MRTLSTGTRARLRAAYEAGQSVRAAAGVAPCAPKTARRYYRIWGGARACGCGLPASHQGWCRARLARSPARRRFLQGHWQKACHEAEALARRAPPRARAPREVRDLSAAEIERRYRQALRAIRAARWRAQTRVDRGDRLEP